MPRLPKPLARGVNVSRATPAQRLALGLHGRQNVMWRPVVAATACPERKEVAEGDTGAARKGHGIGSKLSLKYCAATSH